MHTLIAILFSDRGAALEGVRALHALEAKGSLVIETVHVIRMGECGAVTEERTDDDFPPPSGTLAGLAVGSLIGLLGGAGGAAVAAGIGGMIGLLRDLYESESLSDFLAEVSKALVPGKYAVLLAAKEDQSARVDVQMKELGGIVFRTRKRSAIRKHLTQQTEEFRAEIDELIGELTHARDSPKEGLQTAIDRVRAHLTKRIIKDVDFAS
jgi:uncharacterized membrane protein